MTKIEAYRILGISRSASAAETEQAYRQKHDKLRHQLCRGNTEADRLNARSKMAKLTTAKQVLQLTLNSRSYPQKPAPGKKAKPQKPRPAKARPVINNYQKPQTLAEAWELFVQLSPFHKYVTMILLVSIFLIMLIGLLANC